MRMDWIHLFLVRIYDYVIVEVNSLLVIVYGYSLIGTMETLKYQGISLLWKNAIKISDGKF